MVSRRITELLSGLIPEPTPQASHQAIVFPLNLAVLPSLAGRQVNLFRQWRPATHPCVDLRRALIARQRLQPVDVVAIHQLWRSEGKEGYDLCRDLPAEVVGLARVICL